MTAREEMNVGLLVIRGPRTTAEPLVALARQWVGDVGPTLKAVTERAWHFHDLDPVRLADDETKRPSDFLDEATLRMVENRLDAVLVVTDVGLAAGDRAMVPGLASPTARVAIVSTRRLRMAPRGEPTRPLDSDAVRWNGGTLLLHLFGHLFGARHEGSGAMAPFRFDPYRRQLPSYGPGARTTLRDPRTADPDRSTRQRGWVRSFVFHVRSLAANPVQTLGPVLRSRAPLLPLALPALATAAVVPALILVFTAEIWDVGLNMPNRTAAVFAVVSVLASTTYVTRAQRLFFPRKEKRVLSEHMAVANVSIALTVFLAMVGLFVGLVLVLLAIELYIFPPRLIQTWPTLLEQEVTTADKVRLAVFMSSVGTLTGALAGGVESRTVVRHLALFLEDV